MLTHDFYLHEKGEYKFIKRFIDYSSKIQKTEFNINYITILSKENDKQIAYKFAVKNKLKMFEMYENLKMDYNNKNTITSANNSINKYKNAQFYIFSIPKSLKNYSNFRILYTNKPIHKNIDEVIFMQPKNRLRYLTLSN